MKQSVANSSLSQYATSEDFHRVFDQDRRSLHRLSLLLTVVEDMAERCVRSALEECITVNGVFRKFATSWARRSVITNAIRFTDMRENLPSSPIQRVFMADASLAESQAICVSALQNLQRFVFVMSALEQYTDHECSILLRCSYHDVCEARTLAFRHIEGACGLSVREYVPSLRAWLACSRESGSDQMHATV